MAWARELARDYLAHSITRRHFLDTVFDLCLESDYRKELHPFYLLRDALDDLEHHHFPFVRQDVTKGNFDDILRVEIERLLAS